MKCISTILSFSIFILFSLMVCFMGCSNAQTEAETARASVEAGVKSSALASAAGVENSEGEGRSAMGISDEDREINKYYAKFELTNYEDATGEHTVEDINAIYLKYYPSDLGEQGRLFDLEKGIFYDAPIPFLEAEENNYLLNEEDVTKLRDILWSNNVYLWETKNGGGKTSEASWRMRIEYKDKTQFSVAGNGLKESTYPPEFRNFYNEIEALVGEIKNRDQESK
jgi:hypothetical protein